MDVQKSPDAGLEDTVIGLVAPIGTDPDPVCHALAATFERLEYVTRLVRLTDYLHEVLGNAGSRANGQAKAVVLKIRESRIPKFIVIWDRSCG